MCWTLFVIRSDTLTVTMYWRQLSRRSYISVSVHNGFHGINTTSALWQSFLLCFIVISYQSHSASQKLSTNAYKYYCIQVSTVPRQRLNKMRKTVGLSIIRLNSKVFYLLNKQGGVLEIVTSASAYILYDFKFKERYNLAWPSRSSQLSVCN